MVPEIERGLGLPSFVSSPADVARLRRELARLDEILQQEDLRQASPEPSTPPSISRLLNELASVNNLQLSDSTARRQLIDFLADLQAHAPVVHISFAVDPSAAFMQKIVEWFRQNIHATTLVRVGVQPNIAAGCTVRTTNQYYDCSLREYLRRSRSKLIVALGAPPAAVAS